VAAAKKGGKKGASGPEAFELEQTIEELQNELTIKDTEFADMRSELETVKAEYAIIMKKFKGEKV
jgi:hypothetical protein